jgi:hypothetical protein
MEFLARMPTSCDNDTMWDRNCDLRSSALGAIFINMQMEHFEILLLQKSLSGEIRLFHRFS